MVAKKAKDELGKKTLFLAHREELINQAAATLSAIGLDVAVEMGQQNAKAVDAFFGDPDVVVGTVQTLQSARLLSWRPDHFGMIITDEAHHARAKSYQSIYGHFSHAAHLGITATPDRGDGKNLGAVYASLAYEYPLRTAIRAGWLVPLVATRLATTVDLRGIKTTAGDFNQGELEERISPLIEQLADATRTEIGSRKAVVFTPDVGSASAFASALDQMGVPSYYVAGASGKYSLPKEERRRRLQMFRDSEFQVICCCDLLTEGWDQPDVSAVVIARPTRMRNRYAQMVGRGTRIAPDKVDCLVIDFDWTTDSGSKDLATSVDLFDDSETDDEVIEQAQKLLREGKQCNPLDAIEEATVIVKRALEVKLSGAQVAYRRWTYDPVDVGDLVGIKLKRDWDFNPNDPASARQLDYLKSLGMKQPRGLSRWGAGKCIKELSKRREQGLASPSQVQFLRNLGVDLERAKTMKTREASQTIDSLLKLKEAKRAAT